MDNQPVPQCCGVCRFYDDWWKSCEFSVSNFEFRKRLPASVVDFEKVNTMDAHDGKSCPCFERKEGE